MMRTEDEAMKLYNKNEGLIYSTINRKFNNEHFLDLQGLRKDDLYQYGSMGLYRACREYDEIKGTKFSSFAIANIIWSINVEAKRDSINNINRSSFDLLDKISLDKVIQSGSGEYGIDLTLYDFIEDEEEGYEQVDITGIVSVIRNRLSDKLATIVKMRADEYTYQEIADSMGVSQQSVRQMLKRNKGKLIEILESAVVV